MNSTSTSHYQVGGVLPQNVLSYVKRGSDDQLLQALKAGEFCYVLNSRQMGKTSLMVRTFTELQRSGWKGIILDFSAKDNQSDQPSFWYNGIINQLNNHFKLLDRGDFHTWRKERDFISPVERLDEFIETVLLPGIIEPIVIFVDEIDSTLHLPFTDGFFALIRACYNRRAEKPDYKRLTFALLGVAAPSDLIKDKSVTPFNIGTPIDLNPFPTDLENGESFKIMEPLLTGGIEDKNILQEILNWTGGQPFLTQKLCYLIVTERQKNSFTTVEEVVNLKIINNWQEQDNPAHLKTIQNRLSVNKPLTFRLLDLYKKILQSENQPLEADNSQEQHGLRLSGLVLQERGFLKPYNRIYTRIFNPNWVETEKAKLRLHNEEFENWDKADPREKERYLLYGAKGEQVQQWRENLKGELYETEARFLEQSKEFWNKVKVSFPDLLDDEGMIKSIIQSANDLTGGFDQFNEKIFNLVKKNNVINLPHNDIQGWLENLVLLNLNLFEEYDQFQKDREQFLNQEDASIDSFALISTFEKIAQKEPVPFDENNPQHRKLKKMCFIITDKEHNLRILNKIYEKLMNQDWIKGVMEKLRPYTKAFRDWKSSAQSNSHLLQNDDLKLALEWLGKKPRPTLEESEIEFVMTSLVVEVWATASLLVKSEATKLVIKFRRSLQGNNNYSDFLLQEILEWTRLEPLLLKELLGEVDKTEISTTNYHNWIEQLVKTQIINNWQHSKLAEHFRLIEQGLTNHQSSESFLLIVKYRQILLQGKIEFDETRENTKLIELGLVVKIDQQLKIANPIYENIFSQRWTYQKLSEYKRIRAINLLNWCRANNPEQNDPVLRSYLDEWINNNAPIIEKIVQEAHGEVLDSEFDFIDEIKLLTYDIIEAKTSDITQITIQHSLNRIFKDDIKKMAQNTLDILLNETVENATEIEAIVILGLKAGMVSGKNSNLESNNSSLYQIVRSETFVSFAKLKTIPDILDNFGEKTNFGKLSYAMFTLEKGVVISHFTKIQGSPFAICFISNSEVDMPGLFLAQCEGKFEKIQKELEKVLG